MFLKVIISRCFLKLLCLCWILKYWNIKTLIPPPWLSWCDNCPARGTWLIFYFNLPQTELTCAIIHSHIGTLEHHPSNHLNWRDICRQKHNKTIQVDENKPKYLHSNPDVKSQLGRTDGEPREQISNLFVENNILEEMFTYFSWGPNKGFAGWIRLSQQVIGLRTPHVRERTLQYASRSLNYTINI